MPLESPYHICIYLIFGLQTYINKDILLDVFPENLHLSIKDSFLSNFFWISVCLVPTIMV